MNTQLNWPKLVNQNRAKAYGVPWSREERDAIKNGISPDDVRAGLLTKKEVEKADKKETGEKSLLRASKDELIAMAKEMKLNFDFEAITRGALMHEIIEARNKKEKN